MKATRIINFFLVALILSLLVVTSVFAAKPGANPPITKPVDGEGVKPYRDADATVEAAFYLQNSALFSYTSSTRKGVTSFSLKADFSNVTGTTDIYEPDPEYKVAKGGFSWSGVTGGAYQGNCVFKNIATGARERMQYTFTVKVNSSTLTISFTGFWLD